MSFKISYIYLQYVNKIYILQIIFDMNKDINKILIRLKNHLGISKNTELAEKLGVGLSTISSWKKRKKINYEMLIEKITNIDYNWLFYGEKYKPYPKDISMTIFLSNQAKGLAIPIILVPQKAEAGYLSGFSQVINETLPIFNFKDYTDGHRYRAFEITGDSMEDVLFSGDCVFCEKRDTNTIKNKSISIIQTKEGLLCKYLEIKEDKIILHSKNKKYIPKILQKEDIIEIWKVISIHRELK